MKQYIFTTIIALVCSVMNANAQALTERYNEQRKAVVVGDNNDNIKVAKAVIEQLGIPCVFKKMDDSDAINALEKGQADVAITAKKYNPATFSASKCIISYTLLSADTVATVRFVGKDHLLIDQMDDAYMRLRQDGIIADIQHHKVTQEEIEEKEIEEKALQLADALLVLTVFFVVLIVLIFWHIRNTRRHTREVKEMINQTEHMHTYYDMEDNQAAHDLLNKYETILQNPFVAIAIYDYNGKLIRQNEAMKKIGHEKVADLRKPLYNAQGNVANYFVVVKPEDVTATET